MEILDTPLKFILVWFSIGFYAYANEIVSVWIASFRKLQSPFGALFWSITGHDETLYVPWWFWIVIGIMGPLILFFTIMDLRPKSKDMWNHRHERIFKLLKRHDELSSNIKNIHRQYSKRLQYSKWN